MVNKMDEYFEGKVKEVQSAEDASYFLENNERYHQKYNTYLTNDMYYSICE